MDQSSHNIPRYRAELAVSVLIFLLSMLYLFTLSLMYSSTVLDWLYGGLMLLSAIIGLIEGYRGKSLLGSGAQSFRSLEIITATVMIATGVMVMIYSRPFLTPPMRVMMITLIVIGVHLLHLDFLRDQEEDSPEED